MLSQFQKLMKVNLIPDSVISSFSYYYGKLLKGESGLLESLQIKPPSDEALVKYDSISDKRRLSILKSTAVIKLNGGLGTSMGLSSAKSLLPVKGSMNFLDIIVRQVLALRASSGYKIPLLFMNSFATDSDTLKYLEKYPDLLKSEFPLSFLQNRFLRIRQDNLKPYENADQAKMWNPPGHGDLYSALSSTGLLDKLIDGGYRYAFVSNSDNLGATIDTSIPAYMEDNDIHFLMEVCQRTEMDRKGGHLCEDLYGNLLLREIAQCPAAELSNFQNIELFKYFNTNNLWIDLKALQWHLIAADGVMLLPLIINPKSVDGTPVYQLETAMGAAISVFSSSRALIVPRSRFAPVKKNNELVAVWSDAYELNDQYQIVLRRGLSKAPDIELDDRYYASIDQLLARFKDGVPSLVGCSRFKVRGDISFGEDVICEGEVSLNTDHPIFLKSRMLTGDIIFNH